MCSSAKLDTTTEEQDLFLRTKERLYWSSGIASNSLSPKRQWRDLDLLMRTSDDGASPSSADVQMYDKRKVLYILFDDKVCQIRKATEDAPAVQFDSQTKANLLTFQQITPEQVINLITAAPNKSCVLDPAPIFIVKDCAQLVAPFISLLFNRSVSASDLPPSQQAAIVTSIAKKRGLDKVDLKNFRPVSN